jgi:hypothetical protein
MCVQLVQQRRTFCWEEADDGFACNLFVQEVDLCSINCTDIAQGLVWVGAFSIKNDSDSFRVQTEHLPTLQQLCSSMVTRRP